MTPFGGAPSPRGKGPGRRAAIGIAAMDGTVTQWSRAQQGVALVVMVGLAWLISTAHEAH